MTSNLADVVSFAIACEQAGDLTTALDRYEAALSIDPGNGPARFGQATCLHLLGHFEQALLAYQQAIVSFPDHVGIVTRMAHLHRHLGHLHVAVVEYERARELDDTDEPIGIGAAQALCLLGENEQALAALDKQEESTGASPALTMQRARTLVGLGRFDAAQSLVAERSPMDGHDSIARALLMSDIASARWDLSGAERHLAKAAAEHPDEQVLHLRHAARHLAQLRPDDALAALGRRAALVPIGAMGDVRPRATQGLLADIANEFLLDPCLLASVQEALA